MLKTILFRLFLLFLFAAAVTAVVLYVGVQVEESNRKHREAKEALAKAEEARQVAEMENLLRDQALAEEAVLAASRDLYIAAEVEYRLAQERAEREAALRRLELETASKIQNHALAETQARQVWQAQMESELRAIEADLQSQGRKVDRLASSPSPRSGEGAGGWGGAERYWNARGAQIELEVMAQWAGMNAAAQRQAAYSINREAHDQAARVRAIKARRGF